MYTKRQEFFQDANGNIYEVDSFWFTPTGYIVKWSVVTGIFLIFFCWFVFGYMHAQRRMKKGLPPLAYHRWLVPRYQRTQYQPQSHFTFYQNQGYPQNGNQYNMQNYQEPPPMYNGELPPSYQPPNSTKVDPAQQHMAPNNQSAPLPEVPLPPRVKTKLTTNPLRWLNRR